MKEELEREKEKETEKEEESKSWPKLKWFGFFLGGQEQLEGTAKEM